MGRWNSEVPSQGLGLTHEGNEKNEAKGGDRGLSASPRRRSRGTGEVDKGHTHAICSRRGRGSNWTPGFGGAFLPTPLQAESFQPAASAPKLFGLSDSPSILVSRPPQPVEGGSLKLEINWFAAGLEGAAVSRKALPSALERRELNPGQHSPARASQAPPRVRTLEGGSHELCL